MTSYLGTKIKLCSWPAKKGEICGEKPPGGQNYTHPGGNRLTHHSYFWSSSPAFALGDNIVAPVWVCLEIICLLAWCTHTKQCCGWKSSSWGPPSSPTLSSTIHRGGESRAQRAEEKGPYMRFRTGRTKNPVWINQYKFITIQLKLRIYLEYLEYLK